MYLGTRGFYSKFKIEAVQPSNKVYLNSGKWFNHHYLSWGGGKGGKWVSQDWFEIANDDGDLTSTVEENMCNKRKSRDKRGTQ